MKSYYIKTDAFSCGVGARNIDEAIEKTFAGEIAGITDLRTLKAQFAPYLLDGAWCWIEEECARVVEIGKENM